MLVVDLSAADPEMVRRELRAYDAELAARLSLVVGTKSDLVEDPGAVADPIRACPSPA